MSHVAGLIADTASLSLTVIDQKQYRNIAGSAAVSESFGSSTYMLARLSVLFLPAAFRPAAVPGASVGDEVLPWGTRLRAAAERLDRAGFANKEDQSRAAGG